MNSMLEYKGYNAKIDFSSEDDIFFGSIFGIEDNISFEGSSVQELKTAFIEAVDDYLDMCNRLGKQPEKEYKGSFNIRVSPEVHKKAAIKALNNGISLNQFVEQSIANNL